MKTNRISTFPAAFFIILSFAFQAASAQEKMIQPTEFFEGFPEIKWGMGIAEAKKAVEKTGLRAVRPVETEVAWQNQFENELGRGYAMNRNEKGVDQIGVVIYHTERGREIHEKWLKKLVENQGEPHESDIGDEVASRVWRLKNGFGIEIRLVKATEKLHLVDLRWVKLSDRGN